ARAEFTQAAAEELRVTPAQVRLVMSDTALTPDDGMTAGSGSTPRTVPVIRQAAAAARELLVDFAAKQLGAERGGISVRDGKAADAMGKRTVSYADLATNEEVAKDFAQPISSGATLTAVKEWKVMGTSLIRPNARDVVTGTHKYPSDIARPRMLYGKILRAPTIDGKLTSVDVSAAKAMKNVAVAQSEGFVGVAAPTSFQADDALTPSARRRSGIRRPCRRARSCS